jgi:hypothetical protein
MKGQVMTLFLSWQPQRRRPWTEHNCFPKGAIKWRDESAWSNPPLLIFSLSDDRKTMRHIPEDEWDEWASGELPEKCPFTHSHTRHWCGYDTCRDS